MIRRFATRNEMNEKVDVTLKTTTDKIIIKMMPYMSILRIG
jgi:hypothetical protein